MKTVILAGGLGTRLCEETTLKPKPMVVIGGMPILWHVMNIYDKHQLKEFVIALGYKGELIKEFFIDYFHKRSNLTVSLETGKIVAEEKCGRDWLVHLIDTGAETLTGGRLLRLKNHLKDDTFMLTYGDGVSDVDIKKLLAFHRSHGKIATVTTVRPTARFGGITFEGERVVDFQEKQRSGEGWINGGFFVFEPGIFDYLEDDATILERAPLARLAKDGELMAHRHDGFWQCMDTLREKHLLESLWDKKNECWTKQTGDADV